MSFELVMNHYGKSRMRLLRVSRTAAQHEIKSVRNYEVAMRVGRLTDS